MSDTGGAVREPSPMTTMRCPHSPAFELPNEEKEESLRMCSRRSRQPVPHQTQPSVLLTHHRSSMSPSAAHLSQVAPPRQLTAVVRVGLTAPEVGLIRTPCTSSSRTRRTSLRLRYSMRGSASPRWRYSCPRCPKIAALQARRLSNTTS